MRISCVIEAGFPGTDAADAAVKAISHEKDVGSRSKSKISRSGRTVRISIEADDATALRSSANAYLRALQVFEGIELNENKNPADADNEDRGR